MEKVPLSELPFAAVAELYFSLQLKLKAVKDSHGAKQAGDAWSMWARECDQLWDGLEKHCYFKRTGDCSVYALLRLLFPALDLDRTYSIKEATFVKLLLDALGKAPTTDAAKELRDGIKTCSLPRRVATICGRKCGATGPFEFVKLLRSMHAPNASKLTVGYVNAQLDALAKDDVTNEQKKDWKKKIFVGLFTLGEPSPVEAYWLTCCILKTEWGGARPVKTILDALDPNACKEKKPLFQLCLGVSGGPGSEALGSFMRTAQPARACTPLRAWSMLAADPDFRGEVLIETKVDGWRLQVHVAADKPATVFTHSGRERSQALGQHEVFFGQAVAKLRAALARSGGGGKGAVFDCEVVVVKKGRVEPFGGVALLPRELREERQEPAAGAEGGQEEKRHHCLVLFDLLMSDGVLLTELPLRQRRAELERLVVPIPDWVVLSDAAYASAAHALPSARPRAAGGGGNGAGANAGEARECPIRLAMARAIATRREGLVVKNPEAAYYSPKLSVKLKACYIAGMTDEMHLVVLGADYGTNSREKSLSKLVLGARAPDGPDGSARFREICRTGVGLSEEEIAQVGQHFERCEVVRAAACEARGGRAQPLPSWCAGSTWARQTPAVLLRDWTDAILVDVIASEFLPIMKDTANRDVGAGERELGIWLRYPRIVRLRPFPNGSAEDAHAIDDLKRLFLAKRTPKGQRGRKQDDPEVDLLRHRGWEDAGSNGRGEGPERAMPSEGAAFEEAVCRLRASDEAWQSLNAKFSLAHIAERLGASSHRLILSPASTPRSAATDASSVPSSRVRQPRTPSVVASCVLPPATDGSWAQQGGQEALPPVARAAKRARAVAAELEGPAKLAGLPEPPGAPFGWAQPGALVAVCAASSPPCDLALAATLRPAGSAILSPVPCWPDGEVAGATAVAAEEAGASRPAKRQCILATDRATIEAQLRKRLARWPHGDALLGQRFGSCHILLDPWSLNKRCREELAEQLSGLGARIINLSARDLVRSMLEGPEGAYRVAPEARVSHVIVDYAAKPENKRYLICCYRRAALFEGGLWPRSVSVFVDSRLFRDQPGMLRDGEWQERCARASLWQVRF